MKKVLILKTVRGKEIAEDLDIRAIDGSVAKSISEYAEVQTAALGELVYSITDAGASIYHSEKGWDIKDYDLVIFRKVGQEIELAIAAAHYLEKHNVKYIDTYLQMLGKGKLSGAFLRSSQGIPVPQTVYASPRVMLSIFSDSPPFPFPCIVKADTGSKGRDNFLVHSIEEMREALQSNNIDFIAQNFIPNSGDYRVLVLGGKIRLSIHRKGEEGSHLNNTSQGGVATKTDLSEFGQQATSDIIRATELEKLQVAGVDLIVNSETGQHFILEVNRAPQLATGECVPDKLAVYSDMIKEMIE